MKPVAILALLLLGSASARAVPVTPSFTSGTVTSHTETTTTVTESILQTDYQTGWQYTVTGTNITIPDVPQVGADYSMTVDGAAFQFTESHMGPGLSRETQIDRTTTITSTTDSVSVFTQ